MKRLLILISLILSGVIFTGSSTVGVASLKFKEVKEKDEYTFLVCGLDNAAQNTDAIIVFNYNVKRNTATFIQIPRDTYVNSPNGIKKINSIYPTEVSSGASPGDAMLKLSDFISEMLGVRIDGHISFTIDALARLIDAIGGVDLELPQDISFKDPDGNNPSSLSAGVYHLSGKDAVRFIRYRNGYELGDLGRVDAQKFFLKAFVTKLKGSLNFKVVARSAFNSSEGVITNIKLLDILGIALKIRGRIAVCDVNYANLPGVAAVLEDKKWYYFINRNASEQLLSETGISLYNSFDKNEKLLNTNSEKTINFYYNKETGFKLFTDDDIMNLKVK